MFFERLTEQPNPHSAGHRTSVASGCGTSPHPPGGAASSYSSPHPAATSPSIPGARSWNLSQEPRALGSSCPLLYLYHTVTMTENPQVTPPLSPKPKKMFELQSALVYLWPGGCCRKWGGKSGMNPEIGTSLTGCKRKKKQKERKNICCDECCEVPGALCYFITSTPSESICRNILSAPLARKSKWLWYSLKYHIDTNPRLLQSLVGIESINISNGALFYFQSQLPLFFPIRQNSQWVLVVEFKLIHRAENFCFLESDTAGRAIRQQQIHSPNCKTMIWTQTHQTLVSGAVQPSCRCKDYLPWVDRQFPLEGGFLTPAQQQGSRWFQRL